MRLQKLNKFRYSNQLGNKHYYPSVRISLRLSSNETALSALTGRTGNAHA